MRWTPGPRDEYLLFHALLAGWMWRRAYNPQQACRGAAWPRKDHGGTVRAGPSPHTHTGICTHTYTLACSQMCTHAHGHDTGIGSPYSARVSSSVGTLCWGLVAGDPRPLKNKVEKKKKNKVELGEWVGTIPDFPHLPTGGRERVGPRGQGEAGLTHGTSVGSAGSHPGGLLLKEELTQGAKQFVHVVQLLHFIPLRSRQWAKGLSGLRELLQLLNPRDSVREWGARCGSKA